MLAELWGTKAGPFLQFINFMYVTSYTLAPLLVRPFLSEKCPNDKRLHMNITAGCDSNFTTNGSCIETGFAQNMSNGCVHRTCVTGTLDSRNHTNYQLDLSEPCVPHPSEVYGAFSIVAIYCLLVGILFLFLVFYDRNQSKLFKEAKQHEVEGNVRNSFTQKQLYILYFLFFLFNVFYGGIEVGYSALVTKFGVQHLGWEKKTAAFLVTVVQGTNAAFTALGVVLAELIQPQILILIDLIAVVLTLILLCTTVGSFPNMLWICSALLGISYATIMPAMYTWANNEFALTGIFNGAFWCGFFTSFGVVAVAGSMIHYFGDMWFCYTMLACSFVIVILYIIIQWFLKISKRKAQWL